jgi:hypothetical protein
MEEAQMMQVGPGHQRVSIVSELCTDGTLFDLLVKFGGKGLSEAQVVHIIGDVCRGVLHMHN